MDQLSPPGRVLCERIAARLTRYGTPCTPEDVAKVWSPAGKLADEKLTAAIEIELHELGMA